MGVSASILSALISLSLRVTVAFSSTRSFSPRGTLSKASTRIWDVRNLRKMVSNVDEQPSSSSSPSTKNWAWHNDLDPPRHDVDAEPLAFGLDTVKEFLDTKQGHGCLRGEWRHEKSVSSAYWDPRGKSIVSTSYDDHIRRTCCRWISASLFELTGI